MYEITTIRSVPSADGSHDHIELVGYQPQHIDEPLTVTAARIPLKIAMGESFGVRVGGELVEVTAGTCSRCGFEPHLVTSKDQKDLQQLLALPRIGS